MSVLDSYFRHQIAETCGHPLLRVVESAAKRPEVKRIAVEVVRPKDLLGFKPATIYLHLLGESGEDVQPCQKEDWDDLLNTALIEGGIRAISLENEKLRFSLGLWAALQVPETRFGDGYYNGVLVHHIAHSPFVRYPEVESVLKHIYRDGIDPSFRTYAECRDQIDAAIGGRARELAEELKYQIPEAEQVLAAAVAQYLDERFSVSNRKLMGLL